MDWRKLIFWEFRRGSVQYDIVVGLILIFLFATPRGWFGDTPRPVSVSLIRSSGDSVVFWIDADVLSGVEPASRVAKATFLIQSQAKVNVHHVQVDPVTDAEGEIKGFMAHAKR